MSSKGVLFVLLGVNWEILSLPCQWFKAAQLSFFTLMVVAIVTVFAGPYLVEAPVILDKPDVVYAVEGQPLCITVTLNHVEASVTWRR